MSSHGHFQSRQCKALLLLLCLQSFGKAPTIGGLRPPFLFAGHWLGNEPPSAQLMSPRTERSHISPNERLTQSPKSSFFKGKLQQPCIPESPTASALFRAAILNTSTLLQVNTCIQPGPPEPSSCRQILADIAGKQV